MQTHTVKTRTLQGPEEQPWRCKPTKIHGGTQWDCGHVGPRQEVFYTTVEQGVSSDIYHSINNVYGMAKSRADKGSIKYIGEFSEVCPPEKMKS